MPSHERKGTDKHPYPGGGGLGTLRFMPEPATAVQARRVTVVTPENRFDVSLPSQTPLAHLLPTLLRQAGPDIVEQARLTGGWVLQRFGGWPLDVEQSAAALGVAEGEVLYLRPRHEELAPPVFDDVVDAVGWTLDNAAARWSPAATRGWSLGFGGALLVSGAAALTAAGARGQTAAAAVAAGVAILLILAAGTVSRALDDAVTGTLLGACSAAYALAGGYATTALHSHGSPPATGSRLAAGMAAALLAAAVAAVAVGGGEPVFLALTISAVLGAGAGLIAPHASPAGAAAVVACAAFLLLPVIPATAYRLARLPLPFLPTRAEELRQARGALPGAELAARTLVAQRYVSSLTAVVALVSAAAAAVAARGPGWAPPAFAVVAAVLPATRARTFVGRAQRAWLLAGSATAVAALATGLQPRLSGAGVAALIVAPAVIAAVAVLSLAVKPERSVSPAVSRWLDIAEVAIVIAAVPLTLQILGAYSALRSAAG